MMSVQRRQKIFFRENGIKIAGERIKILRMEYFFSYKIMASGDFYSNTLIFIPCPWGDEDVGAYPKQDGV